MILFTWAIGIVTTITQFTRPPPYLLNDLDSSLFYLAPIVGSIAGEFWGHWFNDFVSNRYIKTHNGRYLPETRLWGVYAPAVLATTSLILYGQTLQHTFPVIALAAAWSIMAFAQVAATTAISVYALDSFPQQAALASSWINFFRTTGKQTFSCRILRFSDANSTSRRLLRYIFPAYLGRSKWPSCCIRMPSSDCSSCRAFCRCHAGLGTWMESEIRAPTSGGVEGHEINVIPSTVHLAIYDFMVDSKNLPNLPVQSSEEREVNA